MKKTIDNMRSILDTKFEFCDVGARSGIEEPWSIFKEFIQISGFEPDNEEYKKLSVNKRVGDKIYPYALSRNPGNILLNLTKSRGCSSLYKPNFQFLNNFPNVERFKVEDTVDVEAKTLDGLFHDKIISSFDFIKIDVQGSELDILRGGEGFLSDNILGMQLEVEFQPMYLNQPLFSEVDHYVTNTLGLQIQDLSKSYWKYAEGVNIGPSKGLLVFGDVLYFRHPHAIIDWCANFNHDIATQKLQMACLMGIFYGYLDYSLCILKQPKIGSYIDDATVKMWIFLIHHYGNSYRYKGKGAGRLSILFNLISHIFKPDYQGWASRGSHLGLRKKFGIFS